MQGGKELLRHHSTIVLLPLDGLSVHFGKALVARSKLSTLVSRTTGGPTESPTVLDNQAAPVLTAVVVCIGRSLSDSTSNNGGGSRPGL